MKTLNENDHERIQELEVELQKLQAQIDKSKGKDLDDMRTLGAANERIYEHLGTNESEVNVHKQTTKSLQDKVDEGARIKYGKNQVGGLMKAFIVNKLNKDHERLELKKANQNLKNEVLDRKQNQLALDQEFKDIEDELDDKHDAYISLLDTYKSELERINTQRERYLQSYDERTDLLKEQNDIKLLNEKQRDDMIDELGILEETYNLRVQERDNTLMQDGAYLSDLEKQIDSQKRRIDHHVSNLHEMEGKIKDANTQLDTEASKLGEMKQPLQIEETEVPEVEAEHQRLIQVIESDADAQDDVLAQSDTWVPHIKTFEEKNYAQSRDRENEKEVNEFLVILDKHQDNDAAINEILKEKSAMELALNAQEIKAAQNQQLRETINSVDERLDKVISEQVDFEPLKRALEHDKPIQIEAQNEEIEAIQHDI